jgi:predicted nucleic acid-binding protein
VKTFFDSSAFAKRYVQEPGSEAVDALCMEATDLALSVVCIPEILSALNRRVRERSLSARQYRTAKEALFDDIRDAEIVNLTPDVISTCTTLLEASPVRAMDALHVACALQWGAEMFVSADERQVAAAKKAGLRTRLV